MEWGFINAIIEFFKGPNEAPIDKKYETYINKNKIYEAAELRVAKPNGVDITDAAKKTPKAYEDAVKLTSPFDKSARFEILNQDHQKYAEPLIKQFFRGNPQTTRKFFEYAHDKVNLELLYYAMVTGIINRNDKDIVDVKADSRLFRHVNINPEKYFDMNKIETDVQNGNYKTVQGETSETKTIFVHINDDVEISTNPNSNVYYFERDIELNMHYRRWYEFNPCLEENIIPMIRRGESFYYKHQQLLAKYNFERLCNGLSAIEPSHFEIIKESEQGSEESNFEHLCKIYEKSFFSNLRNANQGSQGLLDNILQAETALRNQEFYKRCKHLDDLFHQKKNELRPYTDKDIQFEGIHISSVTIQPQILETFWEKDAIDITHKISNTQFEKVLAVHTHLQHGEFEYNIQVKNSTSQNVFGTVRIFLAPHLGEQIPYHEKRRMFVEMDKFVIQFEACNTRSITRNSKHSSVIEEPRGWPRHLLVGKGTKEGFPCDLFVIITQNQSDKLEEDKKMMGFPFDRKILNEDKTENDILKTQFGNMSLKQIQIKHQA